MQRFCKLLSITGAILLAVGALVMCIAAFIYKWNSNAGTDPDIGDLEYVYSDAAFKEVKINTSYGDIEVIEGDTWSVSLNKVYLPKASVIRNNDTLIVNVNSPGDINLFGWLIGVLADYEPGVDTKIKVTYPAGTRMDILHCESGLGTIHADGIDSRIVLMQSPAGKLKLNNCHIDEKIAYDSIFGIIETKNVMAGRLDLDMRSGIADIDMSKISADAIRYNSNMIFSK